MSKKAETPRRAYPDLHDHIAQLVGVLHVVVVIKPFTPEARTAEGCELAREPGLPEFRDFALDEPFEETRCQGGVACAVQPVELVLGVAVTALVYLP